jgi:hypothetical protein
VVTRLANTVRWNWVAGDIRVGLERVASVALIDHGSEYSTVAPPHPFAAAAL